MEYLYLTGGKQHIDKVRPEWFLYEKGIILKYNIKTKEIEKVQEWTKPDKTTDESIILKSGFRQNGQLYVCSQTEAILFSEKDLKVLKTYTHQCMNDVHHVIPSDKEDNIMIASTGLDAVFEIDANNQIVNEWNTYEGNIWSKFDQSIDYRKVSTTKPHIIHPNHICKFQDQIWVTRFITKDAICLTNPNLIHKIEVGSPHDGCIFYNNFCYTTVNGYILMFDVFSGELTNRINMNKATNSSTPLGWCRGINFLNEDVFLVGFSRIRNTKFKANLNWLKKSYSDSKSQPTRIAAFSISQNKFLYEVDLEKHGLNSVFSIL